MQIQMKMGYKYLSHDHDLVAGQVMLFDCLSEDNFGKPVRIYLIINPRVKSCDEKKTGKVNAHSLYQKY